VQQVGVLLAAPADPDRCTEWTRNVVLDEDLTPSSTRSAACSPRRLERDTVAKVLVALVFVVDGH